jgi:hypothetical protein
VAGNIGVAVLFIFICSYMFLIANYVDSNKKYILLGLGVVAAFILIRAVKANLNKNTLAHGQV